MTADIFISYSRRDSEQALALAVRLRSYGATVWMDTASLAAAETWSAEIVTAIEECSIFIILLSRDSVSSDNVTKELSLASECKKRIVPIELHPSDLNQAMKYALAGVQKVSMSDEEALRRTFEKLSIPFEAGAPKPTLAPTHTPIKKRSSLVRFGIPVLVLLALGVGGYFLFFRTSERDADPLESIVAIRTIAVLPFESLSASKDDEFFADGLTSEIISILTRLEGVQVTDRKTAMSYKGRKSDVKAIAKELDVKYIIDGTVQKQGKSVKINVQLINTETGKTLLSESFEGTTDDLIALQEKLARNIAFELQISLAKHTSVESEARRGTNSNEAYSVFLSGIGAIESSKTKEDIIRAETLLEQATTIDPAFLHPYLFRATGHMNLYIGNGTRFGIPPQNPRDIFIADSLAAVMIKLQPKFADVYIVLARIAMARDSSEVAIAHLNRYKQLSPEGYSASVMLGSLYYQKRDFARAAMNLEKAVEKNLADLSSYTFLIGSLSAIGDTAKLNKYVAMSMPLYERFLEKNTLATTVRVNYALNLAYSPAHQSEAKKQLELVINAQNVMGVDLYNAGCAYARLGDAKKAVEMLRRCAAKGYPVGPEVATDPDLIPIKDTPEFKALLKELGH
ncbi:MAG TPA: FlgO family outer membrane protein [Candidatus Kapabacteria bacterium]